MTTPTSLEHSSAPHGRKALGLRRLIEGGFRVPPGLALSIDAVSSLLEGDQEALDFLGVWLASRPGSVAVRSSANDEDGENQSFAGMFTSLLEIAPDLDPVLKGVRAVSESGRSQRVQAYAGQGVPTIPVIIQDMVRPSMSGVLFSRAIDPGGADCAYIEWVHGLGDRLVAGRVTPSSIQIDWMPGDTLLNRDRMIIRGQLPSSDAFSALLAFVENLPPHIGLGWDVEWTIDHAGNIYGLQIRPATAAVLVPGPTVSRGPLPASPGVAVGPARHVDDDTQADLLEGEVLISRVTEASYLLAMQRSSAIVTEEGGLLSHAAIVARELGKPCVVGVDRALERLIPGDSVEVDGTKGIVRQASVTIGAEGPGEEVDWRYLYLYDRGCEYLVQGIPVYLEYLPMGPIAHIDEDAPQNTEARVEPHLRRLCRSTPVIARTEKRIWYREWLRFNRLQSLCFVESVFKQALAGWNPRLLEQAIALLKESAHHIAGRKPKSLLSRLFFKEVGAALHATVFVSLEGHALWRSYEDTVTFRQDTGLRYDEFIRLGPLDDRLSERLRNLLQCLRVMAKLRNESYDLFSSLDVFQTSYFSERFDLLRSTPGTWAKASSEDDALASLYGDPTFQELDNKLAHKIRSIWATLARS